MHFRALRAALPLPWSRARLLGDSKSARTAPSRTAHTLPLTGRAGHNSEGQSSDGPRLQIPPDLGRAGKRSRAYEVLEELLAAHPERVRRIRARQFRVCPGPATAWRWLFRSVPRHSPGCETP